MSVRSAKGVRRLILASLCLALAGCGEDPVGSSATKVSVTPAQALLVRVGSSKTFRANASGADGERILDPVVWSTSDPAVAIIGQNGVATAVGAGTASMTATVGEASGSARLEVFVPEVIKSYEPGRSYWGRQGYVEYIPGRLPLVISAGHGGALAPREISDRTYGVILADRNTNELTMAVRDAFVEQTGFAPHIVISHLHRSKLDPNREIVEAAQDNIYAEHAWTEYHDLIRLARTEVELRFGRGLYLDMHGHSHPIQRIELGYLLNSQTLNGSDQSLDALAVVERSSVRGLGERFPAAVLCAIAGANLAGRTP